MPSHKRVVIIFSFAWMILCTMALFANVSPAPILQSEKDTIHVFKQLSPLVVNVHRYTTVLGPMQNPYQVQSGWGSGFIWDRQGDIVTNFHVVQGASEVIVSLGQNQEVSARIIGVDARNDIAVLRLKDIKGIQALDKYLPIPIADSAQLAVGQKAIAIGNPFGLARTLTTGVVSALHRNIPGIAGVNIQNMIQTDASINPGNSGGPLLDSRGQLIGMNTMIFSQSGTSAGIGFAIPSNTISNIVTQLIQHGKVERAGIGVEVFNGQAERQLGIHGVLIKRVIPNSPAAKAGLVGIQRTPWGQIHLGDIIIKIDGKRIHSYDDLYHMISQKKIGSSISLTILRDGKIKTLQMKTMAIE